MEGKERAGDAGYTHPKGGTAHRSPWHRKPQSLNKSPMSSALTGISFLPDFHSVVCFSWALGSLGLCFPISQSFSRPLIMFWQQARVEGVSAQA